MVTRQTPQRRLLLDLLRATDRHPTADELLAAARERLPRISRGTVYRNLEVLLESGQVRRIDGEGGPARFDARVDAHDHVLCRRCGAMRDVGPATLDAARARAAGASGYRLDHHELLFIGTCPACTADGASTPTNQSDGPRPSQP